MRVLVSVATQCTAHSVLHVETLVHDTHADSAVRHTRRLGVHLLSIMDTSNAAVSFLNSIVANGGNISKLRSCTWNEEDREQTTWVNDTSRPGV